MLVGEQGSAGARAPLSSGRGSGGNRYSRLLVRLPTPRAAGQMLPGDGYLPPSWSSIHRSRQRRRQLQSRELEDTRLPRSSDRIDVFNISWNSEFFNVRLCELLDS